MLTVVSCPSCRRQLRLPPELLDHPVQCPACARTFTVAHDDPFARLTLPPPRSSQSQPALPENVPTLSEVDITAALPVPRPGPTSPEDEWGRSESAEEGVPYNPWAERNLKLQGLSSDYRIELGQWFTIAGRHYGQIIAPTLGYLFLYLLLTLFGHLICGGFFFHLFLDPVLLAGFSVVYLAQLKGHPWSFADFFAGFTWYGALLGNYLLTALLVVVCLLPVLVFLTLVNDLPNLPYRWHVVLQLGGGSVLTLLGGYLLIRTTCFNVLLIIDRNCNPIEAIRGSWQLSEGHFLDLLGVWVVLALVAGIGFTLFFLGGFLFTVPLASLAYTTGYLLIAGSRPPRRVAEPIRSEPRGRLHLEEL